MRAMNLPMRVAMGAVRFSLSRYTTWDEISRTTEIVRDIVAAKRVAAGAH